MNNPYFGGRIYTSDTSEKTEKDETTPIVNSDPFADKVVQDPALIYEAPMGGTLVSAPPLNAPPADETPLFETPHQEIPMGGTVAAVGPMSTLHTDEVLGYETPVSTIPMGGDLAEVDLVNVPVIHETPMSEPLLNTPQVWDTKTDDTLMDAPIPYEAPKAEFITPAAPVGAIAGSLAELLNREDSEHFRTRWNEIQGQFVDEPRTAVQQADALVSEVVGKITQMFDTEHGSLEGQWNQGNDVSTEDLRKALQHYRSFFNRLVI